MYDFLTGPMLWLSLAIGLGGLAVRAVLYIRGLDWRLDRVAYKPYLGHGLKHAVRSVYHFIIPFKAHTWRSHPFFTIYTFFFHFGVVLVPFFLVAHNVILEDRLGFSLPTMPQGLADFLSWGTVVATVFIVARRIALTEVRVLTTWYDYAVIAVTVLPFITGLICRYHVGSYDFWITLHVIFGEAMLIALPFTKLSHAILFFMSRGQLGMDFGIKRGGLKGGRGFAW